MRLGLTRGVGLLTAAVLTVLLTSCGGGARSIPSSTGSASPLQGGRAQATFRIDIPKNAASSKKRSAQYVSPATTQMAINIEQSGTSISGYPVTVGLTPTSGGCSSTLASTYCQLTVALAPGNYTATLTTEDANNTPLSSAQSIAFTITAGANNNIPITLSGIPYTLQVASGTRAMHGIGTSGLTLYGPTAAPVLVTALDADGNFIVGPGAPTYSASVVSGTGWSAASPSTTAPNTIAITPPGTNGSGATFAVTASYSDATCSQAGAVCTATFTIKNDIQTLFIANTSTSDGTVTVYAPPYTGAPTATISNGMNEPTALAMDGAGNLFVANRMGASVTEYGPPYTGTPTTINTGPNPLALAVDNSGNVLVVSGSSTLLEYAPPYTGAATTIGGSGSYLIALDGAGNLFVASDLINAVTEYAPPYTGAPTVTISTGVNLPQVLALDGAGNLFVSNYGNNTVTAYAPPFTGTPTTISNGVNYTLTLALDGAGDLFVGNYVNNTVTMYAPPYTGTPTTISNGVNQPRALAIDGAGNLFVAGYTVTEYAPPYTGTPTTISNSVYGPYALLLTP